MKKNIYAVLILVIIFTGCNVSDPFALLRCQFRIENTEDFSVLGIQLDELEELTPLQILEIAAQWATTGSIPVDFILNIGIVNPNDGSGSSPETIATLDSMEWNLYVDGDDGAGFDTTWVLSGSMEEPLEVPGTGETEILPLDISFDAVVLVEEMELLAFVDLMLAIGGIDSNLRDDDHLGRLLLEAKPEIDTPFGAITYPFNDGWLWIRLNWTDE